MFNELNPSAKPKRSYRLSARGKKRLAAAIRRTKPWERSTGPRTVEGKMAMRQNGIKHGYYSQMPLPEAAAFKAFMKTLKRKSGGRGRWPSAGAPVWGMEGAERRSHSLSACDEKSHAQETRPC